MTPRASLSFVMGSLAAALFLCARGASAGEPFLWRVDHGGRTTYLFGTDHGQPWSRVDPAVYAAAESSRLLVFESEGRDVAKTHPELFWLPKGENLDDDALLGADAFAVLMKSADPAYPREYVRRMRPFYALGVRTHRPDQSRTTMDSEIRDAYRTSKSIEGLETDEEHYRFADRAYSAEVVRGYLRHWAEIQEIGADSQSMYFDGDEKAYLALNHTASPYEPSSVGAVLLDERNALWLSRIERRIRSGGAFVAVGLLHLIEEGGLIEELRRRGYSVARVHAAPAGSPPTARPWQTRSLTLAPSGPKDWD